MTFFHDLRFTLRNMLQKPAFAGMTMAIMTIGLGLCVFNYSFIYSLMFKPLPFDNGDRMYVINVVANGVEYNGGSVIPADYLMIKDELQGVEQMGAYYTSGVNVSSGDRVLREAATYAEPSMFDYTNIPPLKGRVFNTEDNQVGAAKVAVISYEFWQNHLGGRPDIIGHPLLISGESHEVIGVMPDGYQFPHMAHFWMPIQIDLAGVERSDYMGLEVFFLLKAGHSISQINSQLEAMMSRVEAMYPETNAGNSAKAKNYLLSTMGNGGMQIAYAMIGAVLFVMLLACTNVANLLLARASERSKETAIRTALGAPRGRLIMQMMWESLIICSLSGVLALLLSGWGLQISEKVLAGIMNGPMPYFWQFKLDGHIVMVSIAIVLVTAVVTGIIPALKISGGDFNQILRDGTRGAQSRNAGRISKLLVIVEITLSCALLTTAAAMAISINLTNNTDYGANTDNKLIANNIVLSERKYPEAEDRVPFYQELIRTLEAQPDIAKAGLAGNVPGNSTWYTRIAIDGRDNSDVARLPLANVTNMYPEMFDLLDIQAVAGRLYDQGDTPDKPRLVVVTDSFAEQNFGSNKAAIGQRISLAQIEDSAVFTIVGVIPHVLFGQPFAEFKFRPSIITNSIQDSLSFMDLVVQPEGTIPAKNLEKTISRVLFELDRDVVPYSFRSYEEQIKQNTGGMNFLSDLFNLFAVAAVILAASGIYGVMANTIEQRTQELGIRRALGASDKNVLNMLVKQGLWHLFIGGLIGAPVAWMLGSQIVGMMGVESIWLTMVYIIMPLIIGIVVLVSTYLPTLKAIRLEPSVALRYE